MEFGFQECYLMKNRTSFPFSPGLFPCFRVSNLGKIDGNFSWEIVTSSAVLDHPEGILKAQGEGGALDIT